MEWEPPDWAKPVKDSNPEWTPPDFAKPVGGGLQLQQQPQQSLLTRLDQPFDRGNISKQGKLLANVIDEPSLDEPYRIPFTNATIKGLGAGLIEGASDFASGLTRPSNLALMAIGAGEGAAAKAGFTGVANALGGINKAAGAGIAGMGALHGFENLSNGNYLQALGNVPEIVMGSAMALSPLHSGAVETPINAKSINSQPTQPIEPPTGPGFHEFTYEPEPGYISYQGKIVPKSEVPKPINKPGEGPLRTKELMDKFGGYKLINGEFVKKMPDEVKPVSRENLGLPKLGEEEDPNQPQFARNEKGKAIAGVNIRRTTDELTRGYNQPLPAIMVREGLQNAFDAVQNLPGNGHATVELNNKHNFIEISDNGPGLNEEGIVTQLLDIGESGKVDESGASGGKGVGSASYIYGGKKFKVVSVVEENGKKVQYSLEAEPEQLLDKNIGADIKSKVVDKSTPTGVTFRTYLKDDQSFWAARDMLENIRAFSRDRNVTLTSHSSSFRTSNNIGEGYRDPFTKIDQGEQVENIKSSADDKQIWEGPVDKDVDMSISLPKNVGTEKSQYIRAKILNNGLYQFGQTISLGEELPNAPKEVILDIRPKVKEGTDEYPFPTSRDAFKEGIETKIRERFKKEFVDPTIKSTKTKLNELYQAISSKDMKGSTFRNTAFYDPGDRLTAKEKLIFENSPVIRNFTKVVDSLLNHITEKLGSFESSKLERVGIVLDDSLHGVHIPNPLTKKSTILINPFEHINIRNPEDSAFQNVITILHEAAHIGEKEPVATKPPDLSEINDPRIGKFLQAYIEHTITSTGHDFGHGVAFIKRLGNIFSVMDPKEFFNATDKIRDIFSFENQKPSEGKYKLTPNGWERIESDTKPTRGSESRRYNTEVQNLLSIYKESRGRPATTEDFLSPTGIKSESSKGRGFNAEGSNSPDGEGNARFGTTAAIGKLIDYIKQSKGLREQQEEMYSSERSERIKEAMKGGPIKTEGEFYNRLSKLGGEYEKVDENEGARNVLSQKEIDSLIYVAANNKKLLPFERFRAGIAVGKLLDGKLPTRSDLKLLDATFGPDLSEVLQLHGGLGSIAGMKLGKTSNTMKAVMASTDFSAPLRQGLPLASRKEYWTSFDDMFKVWGSEKAFNALQESLVDRPNYLMGREAGLHLSGVETITGREEQFLNNYAESVPGIKQVIRASDRAYTGFLNKLRADTFDSLVEKTKDVNGKISLDQAKEIAKFVNNSTGRGSLDFRTKGGQGYNFEKFSQEMNTVLFSPRLIASRLTMLNPNYYYQFSPAMRKEALKALFTVAGAGLVINNLAKISLGYKNSTMSSNPTNTDFGKQRFGNTRLDPYGGFQQYIVAASRLLSGKEQSSQTGKTWDLTQPGYGGLNRWNVIENFGISKASPMAGLIYEMLKGKDFEGRPVQFTNEVVKRFIPLFIQDVYDLAKSDPKLLPLAIPAMFGSGLQTYNPPQRKGMPRMPSMGMPSMSPNQIPQNNNPIDSIRRSLTGQ